MINRWKQTPISQFCKIVSGSTPRTGEPSYWYGEIGWVTPNDLSRLNGKYIESGERNITEAGLKSCSAELLPANSLIMSSRAPIGYFAININPVATNQGCKSFVCDGSVNVEFFYYALNQYINSIKRLGSGSTFAEVNKKQLENLSFPIPPKEIQLKIADILSMIDDAIQKTDQIIQKAEKLKQGVMSELLKKGIGHKKFKKTKVGEIPDEWEIKGLSEITFNITDGKHGDCKNEASSGYYFVSVKDIYDDQVHYEKARQITKKDFDETHKRTKLEAGDLLLTNSGTIGRMAIVDDSELTKKTTFQKSVAVIKPNTRQVNVCFLMYWLNLALKGLVFESNGSAQKNLLLRDLRSYEVPLPTLAEQNEICHILGSLDQKILSEKSSLAQVLELKKGLMQDIFSQRIQVN